MRWGLSVALAASCLAGCSDDGVFEHTAGPLVYDDFPESARGADHLDDLGVARAFVLSLGFANGQAYQYLDLGEISTTPPVMYLLTRAGQPVAGQFPIVDALPGEAEYSTYWQVVEVAVPAGYKANAIKSAAGVKASGYKQTEKLEAVHCPIVNPDAAWFAPDLSGPYTVFWGTGEEVIPNPFFDPSAAAGPENPATLDDTAAGPGDILLQPVWYKRFRGFCWSEDITARVGLIEADGGVSLDTDAMGRRIEGAAVDFVPGGEVDIAAVGFLPVFDQGPSDAGYGAAVVQTLVAVDALDQPTAADDFADDADAVPLAVVDNTILFPFTLERFQVTIANTTPADIADAAHHPFGAGFAVVSNAETIWSADAPITTAFGVFADEGDTGPLASSFPAGAAPDVLGTMNAQAIPPVDAGASVSFTVFALPASVLSTIQQVLPEADGILTGLEAVSFFDEDGEPIATATADLNALVVSLVEVDPGPPPISAPFVVPHATLTKVGTLTITHLVPGGAP